MKIALCYLAVISLISVAVCILDKQSARRHRRRVPERTLLELSILGGSVAMYVTMRLIRHKTLHKKFMIGIPVIILLQGVLVWFAVQMDLTNFF